MLLAQTSFASIAGFNIEVDFGFGNARKFTMSVKLHQISHLRKVWAYFFSLLLLELITHRPFTVFQKVFGGTYDFLVILRITFTRN